MTKKIIWLLCAAFNITTVFGQNTFKAIIKDSESKETLIGATALLKGTTNGASADANGILEIKNIATGKQTIVFSYLGFEKLEKEFDFPISSTQLIEIEMQQDGTELDEIVVQTTRSTRTIQNIPTRVEAIELEEIDEKTNMRPANVSMLLHESTGIQVQQTSATSANASIRIQGLDGKYTQLLKDGYPNFGGFASGLSVLEIPPLDLKQVEIIKGPASTLYGGGAIAGVVNFISKTPKEKPETQFIINQSHIGQTNIGAFTAQRYGKFGFTILGLANFQKPYDVDKDDFTELPKSNEFTLTPRLFFYPNEKTTIIVGNTTLKGDRTGGDKFVIDSKADSLHTYFEKNKTLRNTTNFEFRKKLRQKNSFVFKTSFSYFDRTIEIPYYKFGGTNYNSYNEVSYSHDFKKHSLIAGGNFVYDKFSETQNFSGLARNQTNITSGIFIQDTWDATKKISIESGLRLDNANYTLANKTKNEVFILPRISALFKWTKKLSSRIGGGLGYKTPTLFTEQTEALQYRNVSALSNVKSEKSYGGTADINYKTAFAEHWFFGINQMFFFTKIENPLVLEQNALLNYYFANQNKSVQSLGFETNAKIGYKSAKLFAGYTLTNAKANYQTGIKTLTLIPKHKLNLALVYEKENFLKAGLEGYYSSQQYLNNGTYGKPFWEFGAMVEKPFKHFSIYINAENFTDTRQSRYKRVVNEPHNNPTFDDIWTHTEGFVLSGGIKIKL
ncbi:MAG: hypothetical protein RL708_178 [Bacteroidota bacterium]|jgi:iron complex outermembrane receptor protein/outer membrane receptor for ferrienterochelin and colicins